MNLELTDEQSFLREAAREALSRVKTVAAARDALEDPAALPDLWPTAREAGWAGLLVSEANGGAGLSAFDAMLVMTEAGRVLAGIELLGHLPASALLDAAGDARVGAVAEGELRACFVAAQPPGDLDERWTVEPLSGSVRVDAPVLDSDGTVSGCVAWVPDAPGADLFVVVATGDGGAPVAVAVDGADTTVEVATRYDATRSLGHVRFDGAAGTVLAGIGADELARAWFLAQSLLAAESLGAVETALSQSVTYAKERFTFGRAIGSYQAVKHSLVEVLRLRENTYALLLYAGWAYEDQPGEFALAASAARSAGGHALDYASRAMISVHGGIGATWEHDAPLFFRRAQLSRRLLGGLGDATDRVAGELLSA
ncbi:MAG TPA: acyl-CoA dehydrogenase family protein, partial [Solirubrobacteraceae bacterium]|nr:acyl-CoA dehydrogenase family protein [Solirubrobacteraceae bacterium]